MAHLVANAQIFKYSVVEVSEYTASSFILYNCENIISDTIVQT